MLSASGRGQVTTGLPPFGSFSGGPFDTVNNANLNVHFEIPVIVKPGRGLPFFYLLGNDSAVWYPSGGTWTPVGNWGWGAITSVVTGYAHYYAFGPNYCYDSQHHQHTFYVFNGFTYVDPTGGGHSFSVGNIYSPDSQNCTSPPGPSQQAGIITTDGSGYVMSAYAGSTTAQAYLISRSGQSIAPPMQVGTGAGSITDPYGNTVSTDGTSFYDTLLGTGSYALNVTGTAPSPTVFKYPNTNVGGGTASVTMNYKTYTVQTNFGCGTPADYPATSASLVDNIVLADGTKYFFTYETTPGHAPNVTGRIASVTLPTGGTISYSYSGGNNGITCADGTTATLTRTTPDGTWSYAHSEGSSGTTTVTAPDEAGHQRPTMATAIHLRVRCLLG